MNLSPLQKAIVCGVLRDRERITALPWNGSDAMRPLERGAWRMRIDAARQGLVRPDLAAWLRREPSDSDFTMASRAYKLLAEHGLIVRHGDQRVTHLSLTEVGETIARKLAGLPAAPSPAPVAPTPAA